MAFVHSKRKQAIVSLIFDFSGSTMLALEMLERALDNGIDADYLLVDSWYAKPNFIKEANTLGMPVIARLPNNKLIWNFKGKYKTLKIKKNQQSTGMI